MPLETLTQGFEFIESFTNLDSFHKERIRHSRLDRMRSLLDFFGNPHRGIKLVHIAGSKGKGSTGTFLAAGIESFGYKTGLYTSPHISSYKERITMAGRQLEDRHYLQLIRLIAGELPGFSLNPELGSSTPTTFELLTLLGFLVFREQECEWAVIETGIGGRVDATNVIQPVASVITPIELEHTEVLGKTIDKIAREKGGIIKQNTPVFCSPQQKPAIEELRSIARGREAPILFLNEEVTEVKTVTREQGRGSKVAITYRKEKDPVDYTISMLGAFQGENSALAYTVLDHIFEPAPDEQKKILKAFADVAMAGRVEIVSKDPLVIIDSAHTPLAAKRITETLKPLLNGTGTLIFGSILGKEPGAMADILVPMVSNIVISRPGTFKDSDPEALYGLFKSKHDQVYLEPRPDRALALALSFNEPILVTGSFYMAGEIRKFFIGDRSLPAEHPKELPRIELKNRA